MSEYVKKLIANDKIRYLIAGGCTTLVNFITFFVLRSLTDIHRNTCNVIAIFMAITFAYFAGKFFVFRSKSKRISANIIEAVSFFGLRFVSMCVELLGFTILCDSFRLNEPVSKIMVQFIVLIMNYVFSKVFIFKNNRKSFTEYVKSNYIYIIPFSIVFVFMVAICKALKIMPFGDNTFALIDSLHQYVPFFAEYRDKLLHEGSLFYTWNLALGSNFMSLMAYYLSSPFNYIFLLMPKMSIPVGISIIVIIKISLSAGTMAYFLANKDGTPSKSIFIIPISVCYALSNYVIGYNWNFMWLDCLFIFPIILLGFKRLMDKGDPKMYVLSLFYCLYCNYYIGFMICVFLILWFFAYRHKNIKKFFTDGITFAFYSLISGGLSAFLLIPAMKGIMSTASGNSMFPDWLWPGSIKKLLADQRWYGSIYEMFKQQFIMTKPITCQVFDGGVNLYCGTFAILAVILYVVCGKIRLSDKIKHILLLAFLMTSFNSTRLNYIWHGFHDQYGIPNRFSFLYITVILIMAYDVLRRIDKIYYPIIIAGGLLSASFILYVDMKSTGLPKNVLAISLALIIAYVMVLIARSGGLLKRWIAATVFTVICCAEILFNAAKGFNSNGTASFKYYDTTPQITAANNRVNELAKLTNAGFYRSELMHSEVLDEVTWHHMPSVGTFCSTVLGDVVTTMGRLGFYTGANEFLYFGSTPFTNSMFNVRYLLERPGNLNNYSFNKIDTVEGVNIYENPYPLSIGYAVNNTVKDWDRDAGRHIERQNLLAFAMTGQPAFFNPVQPEIVVASDNMDTNVNGNVITITPKADGLTSFMSSFFVDVPGDYYISCRGNYIYKIRIFVNGQEMGYDRFQSQIFHIGKVEKEDYISIEFTYKDAPKSENSAYIYTSLFKEHIYEQTYEKLADNMLTVEELDDGYILGTIDMPDNQTLFTTIPYDKGWKVKVDGKECEYYKVAGAFIGVDIEPGLHTVEFLFVPDGLYIGIIISLISLLLFVVGVVSNTNKNKYAN